MRAIGLRWLAGLAAAGVVALAGGVGAAAPSFAAEPTNLPGVTTSPAPPAQFDAVNASDEALGIYGFPPRPNAARAPAAYANWAAAVGAHPQRLVPQLQQTAIYHGPRAVSSIAVAAGSTNWSGVAVESGVWTWSSTSFAQVAADFIVPSVAPRNCSGNWEYLSDWVGIDGNESSDVLQAGVEADAVCTDGATQTYFSPWYEWYPSAEIRIANLGAAPGQSFYVHVWATSATAGHAYLQNLNTSQSVSVNFGPPPGTVLHGESAEWILEAPSINGTNPALPLYSLDYFSAAVAWTLRGSAATPSGGEASRIALVRGGATLSTCTLLGNEGIAFTGR